MKYLQAILIVALLALSKRYREKWRKTVVHLADSGDAIDASMRRIEAQNNGGKPRIKVL